MFDHRVGVIWLTAHCSELNPFERFCLYLKEQVCVITLQPDMAELVQAGIDQLERQIVSD
jgi:hypothetical protein